MKVSSVATAASVERAATIGDYIRITRLDHVTKHIFVVPGLALAWLLRGFHGENLATSVVLGFVCVACIASANYVINEWLDRNFDKHHPTKRERAAVQAHLKAPFVYGLWAILALIGLASAFAVSFSMFEVALIFFAQGIFYNVPPLRTKDKAYLDVISEAINNPLRLTIGWLMIDPATLPPSSLIGTYWLGGAFLMAAKRYSEYRQIVVSHGKDLLILYRKSFAGYDETSLLMSCFVYAMLSVSAMSIFLLKYRIEYVLALPLVIALFAQYLRLSMRSDSAAQSPEKLFRERKLIALTGLLGLVFVALTLIDLPLLEHFLGHRYIVIG